MKRTLHAFALAALFSSSAVLAAAPAKSSDFKGDAPTGELTVGGVAGLSILGDNGFGIVGQVGKKLIDRGFVPDLNNQVFLEGEFGPVFGITGVTAWHYSAHLRWDFPKDDQWTFYALGGVGGSILSTSATTDFRLHPRFGVGAFYYLDSRLAIRAELSHELTAVGVSFRL